MPPAADPEKIKEARRLEKDGVPRAEIRRRLDVSKWTLIRWLGPLPPGRPQVTDEDASERTLRRRRTGR